jgi:hypothetical protein
MYFTTELPNVGSVIFPSYKHQIAQLWHNNLMAQVSASTGMTVQQGTTAVNSLAETNVRRRGPDQLEYLGMYVSSNEIHSWQVRVSW